MRGVTLVETLVAMFLIATVAVFCLGLFCQLSQGVQQSRSRYAAAEIADREIAEWRALPWKDPSITQTTVNHQAVWMGRAIARTIALERKTVNTSDDRQVMTITARWSEPSGPASLVVESVKTR
jgi:Tfp pilus assembly protein PilV